MCPQLGSSYLIIKQYYQIHINQLFVKYNKLPMAVIHKCAFVYFSKIHSLLNLVSFYIIFSSDLWLKDKYLHSLLKIIILGTIFSSELQELTKYNETKQNKTHKKNNFWCEFSKYITLYYRLGCIRKGFIK